MKTSVERVDETTVKLSVTVEAQRVAEAVEEAARRLAQDIKVPGFRPGRVPRRVLETRIGKANLLQEAAREALPVFYSEAVREAELDVVSPPEFDVDTFDDTTDAVFTATVEVRPEIEVPDLTQVQVPHPDWEVTEEEVQEHLDQLRERFAELETVQRGARIGDHVRVTISGSRGGQPVPEASGEDLLYEVEDPDQTDSELDRALIGAEPGTIVEFTDTLGADYPEGLAGTEVDFRVIVKEVKEKRLPEVDDEFALQASEFETAEELLAELRSQLADAKRSYADSELRGKVVEAVADLVEVPLPEAMVQDELRFRLHRIAQDAERYGMSPDEYLQALGRSADDLHAQLEEDAKKTVKAQLVVDAVGRAAGVEVDRDDLGEEIGRQAQRFGRDPEELAEFMTHPERIGALASDAFRRKAIDHLVGTVQVLGGPPAQPEDSADASTDVAGTDTPDPDTPDSAPAAPEES